MLERIGGVMLVVMGNLCLPARAETRDVRLQDATPAEISQALSRALGTPVEVAGGAGRRLSLSLPTAEPLRALDAVATGLKGTWHARLVVRAGAVDRPSTLPGLDGPLPLSLDGVPADRAFGMVARVLRLDLELVDGLSGKITVPPGRLDASAFLDRIARQAGARWELVYRIDAPDAPPPPVRMVRMDPLPESPPAISINVPTPMPAPTPRVDIRAALWEELHRLVRASPAERSTAVQVFVREAQRLLAELDRLPAPERTARLRSLQTVRTQWRRLYTGLAPNVQQELASAHNLLEERLR